HACGRSAGTAAIVSPPVALSGRMSNASGWRSRMTCRQRPHGESTPLSWSPTAAIVTRGPAPAAAAVPMATISAQEPPVKWLTLTPVWMRPVVSMAAAATVWWESAPRLLASSRAEAITRSSESKRSMRASFLLSATSHEVDDEADCGHSGGGEDEDRPGADDGRDDGLAERGRGVLVRPGRGLVAAGDEIGVVLGSGSVGVLRHRVRIVGVLGVVLVARQPFVAGGSGNGLSSVLRAVAGRRVRGAAVGVGRAQ